MAFLIKKDRSTCEPRLFFVQVLQIISISFGVGCHSSLALGVSPTRTLKSSEPTRSKQKKTFQNKRGKRAETFFANLQTKSIVQEKVWGFPPKKKIVC